MAIINSYPIGTPKTNDLVIGTSMPLSDTDADPITKNFPVSDIISLAAAEVPQGPQGPEGAQGPAGVAGPAGATGPQGQQGVQGSTGAQGATGADGTSINVLGTKPTVADLPTTGNTVGDLWVIDQTGGGATAGDGYVWTAGGVWLNIGPLRGPQGIQGVQGLQGIQGIKGDQGDQGTQGTQGLQGTQGPQGIQGIQGETGNLPNLTLGSVYVGTGLSTPVSTTSTVVNVSDSLKSITIGDGNVVSGDYAMAHGLQSWAAGESAVALAFRSGALGHDSFAVGHNSYAGGHGSAAIGYSASAGNEAAATFGNTATAVTSIPITRVQGAITPGMYLISGYAGGSTDQRYEVLNYTPVPGTKTGLLTLVNPINTVIDQICVFEAAIPDRGDIFASIALGRRAFAVGQDSIAIGLDSYTDQANQIAIGGPNLSVVFGDPQKKRTEWNNPGYFEMFAESYTSPGVYKETIDIDGNAFNEGGGFIGTYPSHTDGKPGWRVHTSPNPINSTEGTTRTAPSTDMSFYNNNRSTQSNPTAKMGWCDAGGNEQNLAFAGSYFQLSDDTNNLFRINATVAEEPTIGAYINTDVKITEKINLTVIEYADNAAAIAGGLVIGDVYRTGDLLKIVH